jgi:hypothetical protein
VYEKIRPGIWSDNGIFHLVDAWTERDEHRLAYKFRLEAVEGEEDLSMPAPERPIRRRLIPTAVKLEVWKDVPFSLGGTSLTPANVQLLCARHPGSQ